MQTDDLISVMAAGLRPVDTTWLKQATALTASALPAIAILFVLASLGPREDLATVWLTTPAIAKFGLGGSLAAIALIVFQQSLRPGLRPARYLWLTLLPIGFVVGAAAMTLAQKPFDHWRALAFGRNWLTCLLAVPLYALVPLVILMLLARRGAPVDECLTGTSAGIASAGIAMVGYALHCTDDAAPFLAIWYLAALAIVTALASLIAPRLLRW